MLENGFRLDKNKWQQDQDSLKQIVTEKDREIMTIKAHEYDKVDIIKAQAESEGKIKFLSEETDRLKSQVSQLEVHRDNV